jgi:Flp pilus assembly protein TadD
MSAVKFGQIGTMKWIAWLCLGAVPLCGAEAVKKIFDQAASALAVADYPAAERGFRAVLQREPGNVAALSNLGVIYSRTNRSDEAISAYRRALKQQPNNAAILLNLGLVYLRREEHSKALPLFQRVVAMNPGQMQARQLAALCQAYTGALEPAIRELEALHATSPQDENILFLLGFSYLKNHDTQRAKQIFEQMFVALGPVKGRFLVGKSSYEAERFTDAEESFAEVLKLDPNFPGIHLELGKVYIGLRKTEDAIRELELARKQNPGDLDAEYFLGGLLVQNGRFADGIPYLERAKSGKMDFWAPFFYLGKAKLRLNQPAEAVPLLQRAVALNPDEASAYYLLGRALEMCGRQAEARQALQRVRALRAAALKAMELDSPNVAGAK